MSDTPEITFDQWRAARAQSNGAAVSTKVGTPPPRASTKVDTPAISPTKGELLVLDPTAVYPAEVIQAAKEQEASDGRRRPSRPDQNPHRRRAGHLAPVEYRRRYRHGRNWQEAAQWPD